MKKLILIAIFAILCSCQFAYAQTTEPEKPVVTTQGFIDDATKAFTEVVALRQAVEKYKIAEAKSGDVELKFLALMSEFVKKDDARNDEIKSLRQLLAELRCKETKYFFGLKKVKECK